MIDVWCKMIYLPCEIQHFFTALPEPSMLRRPRLSNCLIWSRFFNSGEIPPWTQKIFSFTRAQTGILRWVFQMFKHRKKKNSKNKSKKKRAFCPNPTRKTIFRFLDGLTRDAPKDSEPIPSIMLKVLQKFFHKWTPEAWRNHQPVFTKWCSMVLSPLFVFQPIMVIPNRAETKLTNSEAPSFPTSYPLFFLLTPMKNTCIYTYIYTLYILYISFFDDQIPYFMTNHIQTHQLVCINHPSTILFWITSSWLMVSKPINGGWIPTKSSINHTYLYMTIYQLFPDPHILIKSW